MLQDLLNLQGSIWEGKPLLSGANAENRKLDESLKLKKIEIHRKKAILEKERDKGKIMHIHYSDLRQEINYTQQLQNTQRHGMEIGENNRRLLEREKSRLKQEIESTKKELESLEVKKLNQEKTISEQTETSAALKAAVHWEEEALLKWLQKSTELEQDKIALVKYTHQDDSKIKELNLMLERLGKEARERKTALDDTDTDVFIAQSEMDRVQDEFRNAHAERQEVIANWEKVLYQLQQRNEEIDSLSKHMAAMQEEEKVLNQKLGEQQQLLAAEQANNKELEHRVGERESYAAKLRQIATQETKQEGDLEAELKTLRNVSTYLSHQVQSTRTNIKQLEDQLGAKECKLSEMEKTMSTLKVELRTLEKETFSAEYYIKELERLLKKENNRLAQVQNECVAVQNAVLDHTQELKETFKKQKAMKNQVKGAEVSNRNMANTIAKLDSERLHQQTMVYRINLNIEQIKQRVRVMEGELANDEERLEMEKEKSNLQETLEKKNFAVEFLNQQVKVMMEKIKVSVKTLEVCKKQNADLADKIDFLDFFITNLHKSIKHVSEQKECSLVDECLVKLQLTRYQDLLRQKNESVMDLQKNQAEFEAVMKERILELRSCADLLQAEVRKEEEECYQTNKQLQECVDKVSKLQTRYEVMLNALGIPGVGENMQVNLLVKAEEEKTSLKQERDDLLAKVIQSEDDLQALQNTLWLIETSIQQFRQALNPPGISAQEYEKQKSLEQILISVDVDAQGIMQQLKVAKKTLLETQNALEEMEVKQLNKQDLMSRKVAENSGLKRELAEVQVKLLRADKSASRIAVDVLQKTDDSDIVTDVKIHLLRELRKTAVEKLFTAVLEYPEIAERITKKLQEAKLPVPSRVSSSLSSRRSLTSCSLSSLAKRSDGGSSTSTVSTPVSSKLQRTVLSPSVVSLGSDLPDQGSSSAA